MQRILSAVVVWIVLAVTTSAQNQAQKPCTAAESSQFDFWLGTWDLEWKSQKGETQRGTNTITKILGDCVLFENFDGGSQMPLKGMSHSVYLPPESLWKQTWVDNSGSYLDFTGGFKDGKMTLSRAFVNPAGKKTLQRMVWYNISKDALEWNWENSTDEGKTWSVLWHIRYKRKAKTAADETK